MRALKSGLDIKILVAEKKKKYQQSGKFISLLSLKVKIK